MLDLVISRKSLGDIEARQVFSQKDSNLRHVRFDHFSEAGCFCVGRYGVEADLTCDSGCPRQGGETDIDKFWGIETPVMISADQRALRRRRRD